MVSFNNVFKGGWCDFKDNPVLIIPGILSSIAGLLFGFILLWTLFGDIGTVASFFLGTVDPFFFESIDFEALNLSLFGLTLLVGAILALIFYAFLYSGLTGMAKEAALTGSTKLGDFFSYGVQYLPRVLCYLFIVYVIIIGIPLVALYGSFVALIIVAIGAMTGSGGAALALVLLPVIMIILLILIILLVLITYFGTYAIVVDDMGVIGGLKKSYYLFMDNKANVFIFVLLLTALALCVAFIMYAYTLILGFIPVIGPAITFLMDTVISATLLALMFAWGVRMYYELTDETDEETVHDEYSEYASIEQGILENQPSSISKL